MIKTLYHASDKKFSKFLMSDKLQPLGYGIYFTDSFEFAKHFGNTMYTCKVNLRKKLANNRISIDLGKFLDMYEMMYPEASYILDCGQFATKKSSINSLLKRNKSDIDIVVEVIQVTNNLNGVYNVLARMGYNYTMQHGTSENVYLIFNADDVKIQSLTDIRVLNESVEFDEDYDSDLSQAEAKSKAQRRLMAMALAYKRGKLDKKYASDSIKKLADSMSEEKLLQFASTKQKKRRKDGSIGKRNAIPNKVKKSK